jgi:hypothetical protein
VGCQKLFSRGNSTYATYKVVLQGEFGNATSSRGAIVAHRDRDKGCLVRGCWRP